MSKLSGVSCFAFDQGNYVHMLAVYQFVVTFVWHICGTNFGLCFEFAIIFYLCSVSHFKFLFIASHC